jgi:hypothetical protein
MFVQYDGQFFVAGLGLHFFCAWTPPNDTSRSMIAFIAAAFIAAGPFFNKPDGLK